MWQLVFRQTYPATFTTGEWSRNPTNMSKANFAILNTLEQYRTNGSFVFKLRWPSSGLHDQIWKQTSNPVSKTGGGVDGYEPVEIYYTTNSWAGLEHGSNGAALLDGSVDSSNWFYAVGATRHWNGGYPGPIKSRLYAVQVVELYVKSYLPANSSAIAKGEQEEGLQKIEALWRYMDTDCNDVLAEKEATDAVARLLEYDAVAVAREWDKIQCFLPPERRGPDDIPPFHFTPNFVEKLVASFLVSGGRVDWGACRIARLRRKKNGRSSDDGTMFEMPPTLVAFRTYWAHLLEFVYMADFECVSESNWARYFEEMSEYYGDRSQFGDPLLPEVNHPSLLEILAYGKSWGGGLFRVITWRDYCNASDARKVEPLLFARWSKASFSNTIPSVNLTDHCLQQQPSSSIMEDSLVGVIVLLLSTGIMLLSLALLSGVLYHYRYRRKWQHMRVVQELLKAKIDTWSTFDDCLQCAVSKLKPSFAHTLGLRSSDVGKICLRDLVHPSDANDFLILFEEFRQKKGASTGGAFALPVKTQVRLKFGFQGEVATDLPPKSYIQTRSEPESYLNVELLLSWDCESSIIVGITILESMIIEPALGVNVSPTDARRNEGIPSSAGDNRSFSLCGSSPDAIKEHVLNASEVSCEESVARTFVSMEAQDHAGGAMVGTYSEAKNAIIGKTLKAFCESFVNEKPVIEL